MKLLLLLTTLLPFAGMVASHTILDFETQARAQVARMRPVSINPDYLMNLSGDRSRGVIPVPLGGCVAHAS